MIIPQDQQNRPMKPFHHLTRLGQLRRLHSLALAGLSHYDLKDPILTYHTFETNLLYRVDTASGERFMLRLASPGWRTLTDLRAEAAWLNALAVDTDIPVPRIIPTSSGENVLSIDFPGVPDRWHMTLMSWVPGRLLGYSLTETNLEKMGRLFAALHDHAATWTPPPGFSERRFTHWLSRGEENRLDQLVEATSGEQAICLPSDARGLLARMMAHAEAAYRSADPTDLRVIHCDLWHDNIKCHRGKLYLFDFEDTVWGYRAHDIAMAMLDLLETVGSTRYPSLLAAFKRGYTDCLAWPEEPIEPFMIGRLLWMINWVACDEPEYLMGMIKKHLPVFDRFEATGQVILPEESTG